MKNSVDKAELVTLVCNFAISRFRVIFVSSPAGDSARAVKTSSGENIKITLMCAHFEVAVARFAYATIACS